MQHLKTVYSGLLVLSVILVSSCRQAPNAKENLQLSIQDQINAIEGTVAIAFYNLNNPKDSLLINADENFHAASTMKVPVMIELFQQASQGKLNLSDSIVLKNEFKSIVDGSPYSMDIKDDSDDVIYDKIGTKVSLYGLMYSMITVSSNLATNVLIELADAKATTETMKRLGAQNILVLRGVEDQKAYDLGLSNTTTARDLMLIMRAIAKADGINKNDSEAMLKILKEQQHREVLPKYLPKEVVVAHKTGSITGVHHDAGIVYLPNGQAYVLVLLSKNLKNFDEGTDQLATISKIFYDYISK